MNYVNIHQLEVLSAMQITFLSCSVAFLHASTFAHPQAERRHFYLAPVNLEFFARHSENHSEMCDCSFKERYCHIALWETLVSVFCGTWLFGSSVTLRCFVLKLVSTFY